MNVNRITDDKNFSNKNFGLVKPNFSNKMLGTNRVILRDGWKIISDTEKVADTFSKCSVNTGNPLKTDKDKKSLVETNDVFDSVLKTIKKYSVHPSILRIQEKMNNNVLSFRNVTYEEILNKSSSLEISKSTQ